MKVQVLRRTFEAAKHPKNSPERAKLNLDALTSEYYTSERHLVRVPFRMSDGTLHPQKFTKHTFRLKSKAEAFADAAQACEPIEEQAMNIRVEPFGLVVQFKDIPPEMLQSQLRNYGFRFIRDANWWHRVSTRNAQTIVAGLQCLAGLLEAPEGDFLPSDDQSCQNRPIDTAAGRANCKEISCTTNN